jgi:hypothetical protein
MGNVIAVFCIIAVFSSMIDAVLYFYYRAGLIYYLRYGRRVLRRVEFLFSFYRFCRMRVSASFVRLPIKKGK